LAFVDEEAGEFPADQAVYRGRFWCLQRVGVGEMRQIRRFLSRDLLKSPPKLCPWLESQIR